MVYSCDILIELHYGASSSLYSFVRIRYLYHIMLVKETAIQNL